MRMMTRTLLVITVGCDTMPFGDDDGYDGDVVGYLQHSRCCTLGCDMFVVGLMTALESL